MLTQWLTHDHKMAMTFKLQSWSCINNSWPCTEYKNTGSLFHLHLLLKTIPCQWWKNLFKFDPLFKKKELPVTESCHCCVTRANWFNVKRLAALHTLYIFISLSCWKWIQLLSRWRTVSVVSLLATAASMEKWNLRLLHAEFKESADTCSAWQLI